MYKYIHVNRTDGPIRVTFAVVQLDETVGFAVTHIQIEVEPTRQEDFLAEFLQQVVAADVLQLDTSASICRTAKK